MIQRILSLQKLQSTRAAVFNTAVSTGSSNDHCCNPPQ